MDMTFDPSDIPAWVPVLIFGKRTKSLADDWRAMPFPMTIGID